MVKKMLKFGGIAEHATNAVAGVIGPLSHKVDNECVGAVANGFATFAASVIGG
jgi:hypothetical protein